MTRFYKVIGLMSGTSLDGLDVVYCHIWKNEGIWDFKIIHTKTFPYSDRWLSRLQNARNLDSQNLKLLHLEYGEYLAKRVREFQKSFGIVQVDLICSHGHTVHHRPEDGITVQIGDGQTLKSELNVVVVNDFRAQDVAFGGQGAPLVPIGDQLLFSQYTACLNLGGFSNISFEWNNKRIAFDIGPANITLNHFARQLGYAYDKNGELSIGGEIIPELLKNLESIPFYKKTPPKSLGIEWVESKIYPLVKEEYDTKDIMRTLVEHEVTQIAEVLDSYNLSNVLVTGGGVYNSFFIAILKGLTNSQIVVPEKSLIEYKEALIFAFLGVLKMEGEINVLSSVTGASNDHSSGKIHLI